MEENKNVETTTTVEKEGSKFGWGVLGFFFPIVGLILFIVWMKNKKKASKAAGIGALIGFILGLISTVLFFALGFSALLGIGSYIENEGIETSTKVEETIEETKTTTYEGETVGSGDTCVVTATLGSKENYYVYDYAPSCDVTKVVDENNKLLFKAKNDNQQLTLNGSITTNNDEELNNTNESFFKVGNSLIFYSSMCSPGYCYIYVYNINDNTGFKIDTKIEEDILAPIVKSFEIDGDNNLVVNFRQNEARGSDEQKFLAYSKIRNCEVTNYKEALNEYGVDNFAFEKTYTYKYSNGSITKAPTITTTKTMKDVFDFYCSR